MKASYKGTAKNWKGIIKNDAGQIVWECGHCHHNRDQSSFINGESAVHCASRVLRFATMSDEQRKAEQEAFIGAQGAMFGPAVRPQEVKRRAYAIEQAELVTK